MVFEKISRPQTLSQEIVTKIEDIIKEKKVLPGDKLPTEFEFCAMFSVSRTAVREALRMLSAKNLITIRKGSGIFVNDYNSTSVTSSLDFFLEMNFDWQSILNMLEIIRIVEPGICKLAALNRSKTDLMLLRENVTELDMCLVYDYEKQSEIDKEFHSILVEASKNPILKLIMEPILKFMPKIRLLIYSNFPNTVASSLDFHKKILHAIDDQNGDKAFSLMEEHLINDEKHSSKMVDILFRNQS